MSSASGLALSIRKAVESETFDLAGQNVTTITNTIRSAFSEPMPLTEMIRITFVTGAGKLGRQKYDEGAAKAVTSTLRELGYEEDRGASAVLECAGSFKQRKADDGLASSSMHSISLCVFSSCLLLRFKNTTRV